MIHHAAASASIHPSFAAGDDPAWARFAAAATLQQFCDGWLSLLCTRIACVEAGVLLTEQADTSFTPAAVWPSVTLDVSHLAAPVEQALASRRGVVARDAASGSTAVAYPVEVDSHPYGVVVLSLQPCADAVVQGALREIHWAAGALEALFRRESAAQDSAKLLRVVAALDLVAVAGEHPTLKAASMALVSELAKRLACQRVSIGFLYGDQIRLQAISNAATVERKQLAVAAVENAMEEALDQQCAIVYPAPEGSNRISIAHGDLAAASGAGAIMSVPIVAAGKPVGILCVEFPQVAGTQGVELLEGVGQLVGPLLFHKLENERWLGGKAVGSFRSGVRAVFGPRRAGAKFAAIAAVLVLAFLSLASGTYRVTAKAVIEGAIQRAAVAPFEGFVLTAPVRAGTRVQAGQLLATLDDRELLLERDKIASEREQSLRKYRDALARHERTGAAIVGAELAQAEAQLALVDEKLVRTRVLAPFDGIVVSGDLSQMLGSPVEQGKVLFEVAPLDAYRAVLQVDERDIIHVRTGQPGVLVLSGKAAARIPFTVRQVTPISSQKDGGNTFRIEAQLAGAGALLRPGMEGVGKIEIGEHKLIWIWTHRVVDWVRLTLWRWAP